jgi:hypothetical protein
MDIQRFLIGLGLVILAVGIVWPILSRIGLGRLPGDIVHERDGTTFYFPLVTCILISVVLQRAVLAVQPITTERSVFAHNPRPQRKIMAISKKNPDSLQGLPPRANYLWNCQTFGRRPDNGLQRSTALQSSLNGRPFCKDRRHLPRHRHHCAGICLAALERARIQDM